MGRSPNRFLRRSGTLSYRRRFVLAVEGAKTEREYFAMPEDGGDKEFIGSLNPKTGLGRCKDTNYKAKPA